MCGELVKQSMRSCIESGCAALLQLLLIALTKPSSVLGLSLPHARSRGYVTFHMSVLEEKTSNTTLYSLSLHKGFTYKFHSLMYSCTCACMLLRSFIRRYTTFLYFSCSTQKNPATGPVFFSVQECSSIVVHACKPYCKGI